ncbi:PQQ-dependent sugar dehydrogenase [Chitinophaga niabensis]|uniref:CBM96 family carbohydrate-binding protein n=1 Tax=Chitinophaga niabensis TaxID=536979 RepID=UPI0031BAFEC4
MIKTDVLNKFRHVVIPLLLLLLLAGMQSYAQTLPANFQRVLVTGGLTGPTTFAQLPDGRILIGQQNGQLRVFKNNALLATPAVSLSVNTSGERGLIGIAVDPAFSTNNYIYLYYTSSSGPHNRVSRFTMSGDLATAETAILDMPTLSAIYHNGGGLAFDNTGKLLIAVGDNKVGGNSSNLDSYMGKVLRINTDGTVPSGNPFSGGAQRSRVWAYGLRNPFTLNVDPVSGKIYVNDVGEATWEEVNDASVGGRNFGWPSKEGICSSGCTGLTNPIYYYATNRNDPPATGQGCAINGGAFLNGSISNWPATYHGKYFFLDYCGEWIDYINPSSPATRNAFGTGLSDGLTTLKQGIDGNLYFIRRGNNSLYKIIYSGNAAPVITTQPQSISVPQGQTATFSVTATGNPTPTYQWRKGTTNISGATASSYSISNVQSTHAGTYNVVVTNSAGSVTSNNATLTVTAPNAFPVATITSPANGSSFRGGDQISFTGTGTDAEDGNLPASAYTWWVDFHHANHTHPGPELADGVTGGSFPISAEGHTETDIWYRLYLEVTDSQGEKDTTYIEIFPVTADVTLQTVPAGLQLTLNEIPFTTPATQESLSGMVRPLAAPSPQTLNGTTYIFDYWEHGGARQQNITVTDADVTYTAHFKVAPAPVNLTPLHDAYVRDGSNAAITHGTTDSTLLITKLSPSGQLNNARESYLQFDLSSISSPLASVVLKVYGKVDLTTVPSVGVGAYSVANTTWTENTLTWNNKPATSASPLATVTVINTAYAYYNFDVTAYVQAEKAAGRNKVSFALKSQVAHDPRIFWNSSEFGSNPPLLSVITDAGGNISPAVSLTAPTNGASFTAPANITLTATATDSDGTVTKVEFFNGASKLGEDLDAPYSFAWNNVPAGTYSLTAKATDNAGGIGTSSPAVNITVTGAPSCDPVTASGDDGNVAANVLDNNLATRWSANGDGQWIAFCLGSVQTVTGVQIAFYNGNVRSSNFDIQVSSNGTSWNTVAAGLSSSGTSLNLETFTIPSQSTQYVRILGHGNSVNLWNSYTEVKITTSTGSTETTLAPIHDAYARNGTSATITHGTTDPNALVVKLNSNPAAGNDRQAFLTFNTSSITSTVTNVKIRLYGGLSDNRSSNTPLTASAVATTSWTESALTWNNKPAIGSTLATTTIPDSIPRYYTWDVTSYVLAEKAAGRHTVSFAITATTATTPILSFNSKEAGSNAPQLVVTHNTSLAKQAVTAPAKSNVDLETALQGLPNPFGDNLTVTYTLKTAGRVQLSLIDLSGRQAAVLTDAVQAAGTHRVNHRTGHLPSGMYILKLSHHGKVITQKLVKE